MRLKRMFVIVAAVSFAVAAWAQQERPIGEVLEGKIRQAAFQYYLGLALGDPEYYLRGVRLPLQTVRNGKTGAMDDSAARKLLKAIADKQAGKPLSKDDRTQVVENIVRTLDEADVRFIGANTATLVFLVRQDPVTKAEYLCSLTLHRADPRAGEWKVIQEVTDSEPVPPEYVK